MRKESIALLLSAYSPPPTLNPWQWAEANVDYSRARSYDTEWKGVYSADYMPYWKEPVEAAVDPDVREVWVLKCSRAGGSENLLLNLLRYGVACDPQPTLYLGGKIESVERFAQERIVRGMKLADSTDEAMREARVTEH